MKMAPRTQQEANDAWDRKHRAVGNHSPAFQIPGHVKRLAVFILTIAFGLLLGSQFPAIGLTIFGLWLGWQIGKFIRSVKNTIGSEY
ncbi:hypothetical protein [uncultured Paraglaciecola sp.]|uniref:hypothetical protein n=1 Tax=uncultured Paraglaciecola sp. TaxID=1765024 RepID=UPI0026087B5F|nr:hypothetical protein [uncultured Paraglaciecola sp.]